MASSSLPEPKNYIVGQYKKRYSFEQRQQRSEYMLKKYKNNPRYPICIEFEPSFPQDYLDGLDGQQYIIPATFTMGTFILTIRKKLKNFPEKKAMFILVNNKMCRLNDTIEHIYDAHKDEDGLLYFCICLESTFGSNLTKKKIF